MTGPFFVEVSRKSTNSKPRVRVFIYLNRNTDDDVEVPTLGGAFQIAREELAKLKDEKVLDRLNHVEVRIKIDNQYRVMSATDWQVEGEPSMYELKHDGNLIETGPVNYLYYRLHHIQGQSWDYALKHCGYSIEPKNN